MRHGYSTITPAAVHAVTRRTLERVLGWTDYKGSATGPQLLDLVLRVARTTRPLFAVVTRYFGFSHETARQAVRPGAAGRAHHAPPVRGGHPVLRVLTRDRTTGRSCQPGLRGPTHGPVGRCPSPGGGVHAPGPETPVDRRHRPALRALLWGPHHPGNPRRTQEGRNRVLPRLRHVCSDPHAPTVGLLALRKGAEPHDPVRPFWTTWPRAGEPSVEWFRAPGSIVRSPCYCYRNGTGATRSRCARRQGYEPAQRARHAPVGHDRHDGMGDREEPQGGAHTGAGVGTARVNRTRGCMRSRVGATRGRCPRRRARGWDGAGTGSGSGSKRATGRRTRPEHRLLLEGWRCCCPRCGCAWHSGSPAPGTGTRMRGRANSRWSRCSTGSHNASAHGTHARGVSP